ncbi:hypothetical protein Tco_1570979 [Tanacetum coccineum]
MNKKSKNVNDDKNETVGNKGENDLLFSSEIKDNGDVRVETKNREDLGAAEHDETKVSDSSIKGVDCVQLDCDNGELNGDDTRENQWFENHEVDVDNAASNGVNGPDHSVEKVTELMDNVVDGCILGDAIVEDPVSTPRVSNFIPNAVKKYVINHVGTSKQSYAHVTTKSEPLIDNKLKLLPTKIDENGNEYVIFDDELISDGSSKWKLHYLVILLDIR